VQQTRDTFLDSTEVGTSETEIALFRNLNKLLRITNFIVALLLNLSTINGYAKHIFFGNSFPVSYANYFLLKAQIFVAIF